MKKQFLGFSTVLFIVVCTLSQSCREHPKSWIVDSEMGKLRVEVLADSIRVPFGMAFLPSGELLVTDRATGDIILLDGQSGKKIRLKGVPSSLSQGDGGALDVLPHPDYKNNGLIYFSHAIGDTTRSTMAIDRATLQGDSLIQVKRIFTAMPYYEKPNHFGTRMLIKDRYLFFTMGERYFLSYSAQSLDNHLGKTMRLFEDGGIPADNPYVGTENAQPEIWSYGHRNPQGLALHPDTGQLWLHEHGPKGGDEVNIIQPGLNYGWPVVSYGRNYDGTPVGMGLARQKGLEPPIYQYTPSIAPSGMAFYTGEVFPQWKGNLFIGGLALQHLNRLVIEDDKVVHEERLLKELEKRARVVKQGPDGYLYVGVDGGMVLRIVPN